MSACISSHGEYSSHTPDDRHECTRCHILDEDALRAEVERLKNDLIMVHERHLIPAREEIKRLKAQLKERHRDYSRSLKDVVANATELIESANAWRERIENVEPADTGTQLRAEADALVADAVDQDVQLVNIEARVAAQNAIVAAADDLIAAWHAMNGDGADWLVAAIRKLEKALGALEGLGSTPNLAATSRGLAGRFESECRRCGGPNITWSAPSPLWNEVMRGGDINGKDEPDGIICPICFAALAEQAGIANLWRLDAKRVHRELTTVTPSGRVWDAELWLWVDPKPQVCDNRSLTYGPCTEPAGHKPVWFEGDFYLHATDGCGWTSTRIPDEELALSNARFPVGTPVRYWPVLGEPEYVDSVTRTPVWRLGHGRMVVSIDGKTGGLALDHIELIEPIPSATEQPPPITFAPPVSDSFVRAMNDYARKQNAGTAAGEVAA